MKDIEYLDQIIKNEGLPFDIYESQQYATVVFDREEDSEKTNISILKDGNVEQFMGNNEYNPSERRHATCIYIREEQNPNNNIKICIIQHKGITILDVLKVSKKEFKYLFIDKKTDYKKVSGIKSIKDFASKEEYFTYFHSKFGNGHIKKDNGE